MQSHKGTRDLKRERESKQTSKRLKIKLEFRWKPGYDTSKANTEYPRHMVLYRY